MARILVVDDDKWYLELLVEMLVEEGHQVVAVEDGVQALARLQLVRPDLVITDMLMPNKDGVDTIMELTQNWQDVPVIAISGGRRSVTAEFNLESAKLLGVKATLAKPFSRAVLQKTIQEVLA